MTRLTTHHAVHGHARRAAGAFTLVEVIVVIVLLSVLSAVVVPRLGNMSARAAANEAESAAALLSVVAQRSVSGDATALVSDPAKRELRLEIRRSSADELETTWAPAPLARPVRFERLTLRQAVIDGGAVPGATPWRSESGAGVPAPLVSLLLAADDGEAWQIDLNAGRMQASARRLSDVAQWQPGLGAGVDLDAQGGRDKPW